MVHISEGAVKMEGIPSINTCSTTNSFCERMAACDKNVCAHCYARRFEGFRKGVRACLERNSTLLSSAPLKNEDIPYLNSIVARFHSFGEVINAQHVENLEAIAKKNKHVMFAIWTKRAALFVRRKKIKNIVYIFSCPTINGTVTNPRILKFFDHIYTVVKNNKEAVVNCPAENCLACGVCYKRGGPKFITAKSH